MTLYSWTKLAESAARQNTGRGSECVRSSIYTDSQGCLHFKMGWADTIETGMKTEMKPVKMVLQVAKINDIWVAIISKNSRNFF